MKFEQYSFAPEIKRSIEELGFKRPTDIQFKAIPPILRGEDVLAIAQTGTGKTAAFAIPILQLLNQKQRRKAKNIIQCLVMVPTRELAVQISETFINLAKHTKLNVFCLYGGVEQAPQIAKLETGVDVLISTPGRMFDLVSQGYIHLDKVEFLVLDEADKMLDSAFIRDIQAVRRFLPKKYQTLFFSATIDAKIKELAYSVVKNPIRIHISPKDPVAKNIIHSVAFIQMDDKRMFLERIIKEKRESKILVFVRTKVRAERVFLAMQKLGIATLTIHGDKEQKDRLAVLNQFKEGETKVLIATDVSARGIDIPNVDFVINYDLPEVAENYVHRVGRTGRANKKGNAISFCSTEEREILERIEKYLGNEIEVMDIPKDEYEETLLFSEQIPHDWRKLIKQINADEAKEKDKRKRKDKTK
ncbi:MAG: DEAD/DEAH box helicase [Bacteroidia bacterium]